MFEITFTAIVLIFAFVFGSFLEKKHLEDLERREYESLKMPITTTDLGLDNLNVKDAKLVVGQVALADNYFTNFLGKIKGFFGGNIPSYELLIDRARREAVLRMKESAIDANMIVNIKVESCFLNDRSNGSSNINSVQVLVSGTALYFFSSK
jgi:uncharacterized protein YbjQ (UPF0145 family)